MTKQEVRNQIRKNELALATILDEIKTRKTEATAVETANMNNLKEDNTDLQRQLSELDKVEITGGKVLETTVKDKPFSILRAIREVAEGRMDYLQHPYMKAAQEESRKSGLAYEGQIQLPVTETRAGSGLIVATTAGQGSEIVPTQKFNLLGALRSMTVLGDAGATILTGLKANASFPIYGGSSAAWYSETGTTSLGGGTFTKIDYTPKRISCLIDVSKLFLIQDNVAAEELLIADIQKAIAVLLENTILGSAASSATQPGGIFNSHTFTSTGTNGADISGTTTWAMVVGLEGALLTANKILLDKTTAYIIHPTINTVVKTTSKASNQAIFIRDNNGQINGYNTFVTSNMPTNNSYKGVAFADWSDLIITQFGNLDLTIDPYSQAAAGNIRIVANVYFDAKFRRTASYALAMLK